MMKTAIIIPARDEAVTVSKVIAEFYHELPDAEIWVVNNCSTDNTAEVAREAFEQLGAKGGVLEEPKRGKSNACRKAFREVDADVYVMVDGDLTYPADCVHDLIEPILQ